MHPELLTALTRFAACDLSVDALREIISNVSETYPMDRWLNLHELCEDPRIRITRAKVGAALEMRRTNAITEYELIAWARTVLTNNVFFWDGDDANNISVWINQGPDRDVRERIAT